MTHEEIIKLNNQSVLTHKFQLELDGFDKKFVKETSFPNFNELNCSVTYYPQCVLNDGSVVSIKPGLVSGEMQTSFYYNAAPEIIRWMNDQKPRNGKITVFDNSNKPFIVFELLACHLKSVYFGHGNYEGNEVQTIHISYSCLATPKEVD